MAKRTVGNVIWLALVCAKQDRDALIDAYRGDKSEQAVKDALADVRAFEKLQLRLFGTTKTELQAKIKKMTSKSLLKVFHEDFDDK